MPVAVIVWSHAVAMAFCVLTSIRAVMLFVGPVVMIARRTNVVLLGAAPIRTMSFAMTVSRVTRMLVFKVVCQIAVAMGFGVKG